MPTPDARYFASQWNIGLSVYYTQLIYQKQDWEQIGDRIKTATSFSQLSKSSYLAYLINEYLFFILMPMINSIGNTEISVVMLGHL